MIRQRMEIIVVTSIDPGENVPGAQGEIERRVKEVCDDVLGIDSFEAIEFEYGEPC